MDQDQAGKLKKLRTFLGSAAERNFLSLFLLLDLSAPFLYCALMYSRILITDILLLWGVFFVIIF